MIKGLALGLIGMMTGVGIALWSALGGEVYLAHLAGAFLACF